jgi:carboxypeptidase Taq
LWENCIGRSLEFIQHNLAAIQQYFPVLKEITARQLFNAVNKVQPSLIRTEADELTYHFHVMIRYEVEKRLIDGNLPVKDVPEFWNENYKSYLGVNVPDAKNGCLQDIHWSHGSFGYFPTYSLGSLYAAQFFAFMQTKYPGLTNEIAQGNYSNIHQWLQSKVYQYGKTYTSNELCNKATGEPLEMSYFLQYLNNKYQMVYHA